MLELIIFKICNLCSSGGSFLSMLAEIPGLKEDTIMDLSDFLGVRLLRID